MGVERCEPSSRERPANVSDVTSQIFKTNLTIRSIIPCAYEIPRFVAFGDSNRLAAAKLLCEATHLVLMLMLKGGRELPGLQR